MPLRTLPTKSISSLHILPNAAVPTPCYNSFKPEHAFRFQIFGQWGYVPNPKKNPSSLQSPWPSLSLYALTQPAHIHNFISIYRQVFHVPSNRLPTFAPLRSPLFAGHILKSRLSNHHPSTQAIILQLRSIVKTNQNSTAPGAEIRAGSRHGKRSKTPSS